MIGSDYQRMKGYSYYDLIVPNNAIRMLVICQPENSNEYLLMNVCHISPLSEGALVQSFPRPSSITRNDLNIIKNRPNFLLQTFGNISRFISRSTQLSENTINLKVEDPCNYVGIDIQLEEIGNYITGMQFDPTPPPAQPSAWQLLWYGFVISVFIFILLIFIFMVTLGLIHLRPEQPIPEEYFDE